MEAIGPGPAVISWLSLLLYVINGASRRGTIKLIYNKDQIESMIACFSVVWTSTLTLPIGKEKEGFGLH